MHAVSCRCPELEERVAELEARVEEMEAGLAAVLGTRFTGKWPAEQIRVLRPEAAPTTSVADDDAEAEQDVPRCSSMQAQSGGDWWQGE